MKWWTRRHPGGDRYEERAERFLRDAGLTILERNAASKLGELDLVAEEADGTIVFVEVRGRADSRFGGAAATVDRRKQARMLRLAEAWLLRNELHRRPVRLDVLAFDGPADAATPTHFRNAFGRV